VEDAPTVAKLYLDEDMTPKLARMLRQRGYDVVSAYDLDHVQWTDEAHLIFAAQEGRVLLTYNARHYAPLFTQWWTSGQSHAGIIVSQQLAFGELFKRVLNLLNNASAQTLQNTYRNLAEFAGQPK